MNMIKKSLCLAVSAVLMGVGLFSMPDNVFAAEATVTFGSESYTSSDGVELQIGVYIDCDEDPDTYYVELGYDNDRMEYVSGAEYEKDGFITLRGTATDNEVKYMLNFDAISGGNAGIYVRKAIITTQSGEEIELTDLASAPITIEGDDSTGKGDFVLFDNHNEATVDTNIPLLGTALTSDDETCFIVDLSAYIPEEVKWDYQTVTGTYGGKEVTFLTGDDTDVKFLYLMDAEEEFHLYVLADNDRLYACEMNDNFVYTSASAISSWPEGLDEEYINKNGVFYALFMDGSASFVKYLDGEVVNWDYTRSLVEVVTEEPEVTPYQWITTHIEIFLLALLILYLFLHLLLKAIIGGSKKRKARKYIRTLPEESVWDESALITEREERIRRQKNGDYYRKDEAEEEEEAEDAEEVILPETDPEDIDIEAELEAALEDFVREEDEEPDDDDISEEYDEAEEEEEDSEYDEAEEEEDDFEYDEAEEDDDDSEEEDDSEEDEAEEDDDEEIDLSEELIIDLDEE